MIDKILDFSLYTIALLMMIFGIRLAILKLKLRRLKRKNKKIN